MIDALGHYYVLYSVLKYNRPGSPLSYLTMPAHVSWFQFDLNFVSFCNFKCSIKSKGWKKEYFWNQKKYKEKGIILRNNMFCNCVSCNLQKTRQLSSKLKLPNQTHRVLLLIGEKEGSCQTHAAIDVTDLNRINLCNETAIVHVPCEHFRSVIISTIFYMIRTV